MHSYTVWKLAAEPNYTTNIDQDFPYSDLPYQGESGLLKIPVPPNNLITHVDYFGEGRVVSTGGISGFANCYNVNHQYRLVSSGSDKDKKIPNRIPVLSYTDCNTSAYVKDNSVLTVTVAGERINSSCTKDIARIINRDHGKVIVFGVRDYSQGLMELTTEMKKKGIFPSIDAALPDELQGLTSYDGHVAFLNSDDISTRKNELYNNVVNGNYDSAVYISRSCVMAGVDEDLNVIIHKLIREASQNAMVFAYKLWHGGAQEVVRKYFPDPFQYIINEDTVIIANYAYGQALKLDSYTEPINNNRAVLGDNRLPRTSSRLSWKFLPECKGNNLTFKVYNTDCNMFIKMDDEEIANDHYCWGLTLNEGDPKDDRFQYYLEPEWAVDADVVFQIKNVHQEQRIKLESTIDKNGDRLLWGNCLFGHDTDGNRWIIAKWSSCQ